MAKKKPAAPPPVLMEPQVMSTIGKALCQHVKVPDDTPDHLQNWYNRLRDSTAHLAYLTTESPERKQTLDVLGAWDVFHILMQYYLAASREIPGMMFDFEPVMVAYVLGRIDEKHAQMEALVSAWK